MGPLIAGRHQRRPPVTCIYHLGWTDCLVYIFAESTHAAAPTGSSKLIQSQGSFRDRAKNPPFLMMKKYTTSSTAVIIIKSGVAPRLQEHNQVAVRRPPTATIT